MPRTFNIQSIINSSSLLPTNLSRWLNGDDERVNIIQHSNQKERCLIWEFLPKSNTMGPPGFCHGGFLFSVMDECMGALAFLNGHIAMAASVQVKFREPVPLNQVHFAISELIHVDTKRIHAECVISDIDNNIYAYSSGVYIQLPKETIENLISNAEGDI